MLQPIRSISLRTDDPTGGPRSINIVHTTIRAARTRRVMHPVYDSGVRAGEADFYNQVQ